MGHNITHANVLDWAAAYDGPLFHALLCDPPYHLTSITDRFSKPGAAPVQHGTDGAFARASRGFMGRDWDGGDIAFRPETWAAFGRLLHPGAFGMAFASTRGFHRMAVAIEDAGFIIHPVIMCWAFGSGFPKATRLDVQIDRASGADPVVIGSKRHQPKFAAADFGYREKDNGFNSRDRESFDLTAGATPLARTWGGHRYGMQALKPALEPIIVFQKPYQGRPVDCITRTGAGAINIDGGRIGRAADDRFEYGIDGDEHGNANTIYGALDAVPYEPHNLGRWPSNLLLAHHPDCNGHCVEDCPVRRLGEQSGESEATRAVRVDRNTRPGYEGGWGPLAIERGHDDSGTAARYFFNADWMAERLEDSDPLIYQAKASTAEREAGLENCETLTLEMEVSQWEGQAQKVQLLVDTATLPPRVIAVCGSQNNNVNEWSTMLFGSESMAQSLRASKFIIGMKTSSTMPLKTLNWLTHLLINDSTADVSYATMDGGSHAASVAPSITSITTTNKAAVHLPGVGIVLSETRLTISARESFAPTLVDDGREKSIDNAYQRGETQRRQIHPTIKPIALARHLATLLLPPDLYAPRRLFVPFAGVASEMIGAMLAGWEHIEGVELEADHIPIARARLDYWQARKGELSHPTAPIKVKAADAAPEGQLKMF